MCVCSVCVCMYLYMGFCTWVSYPWRPEESIRSLETVVTGRCEPLDGCWIPNSGPLDVTVNGLFVCVFLLCWCVGWFGVWESNSVLHIQSMRLTLSLILVPLLSSYEVTKASLQILAWLTYKLSWKYPPFSCCDKLGLFSRRRYHKQYNLGYSDFVCVCL